ncbi:FtsW/RodA/SpoVE family cell cycle protein [Sulfurovum sp. NBC37-1]|uniref:FtsW/RodA/SpoVE family cell cycle protein n=1 Tax=Sulfurovum sp. (strain NBC37-1) TaxID=387093 RepID=UPI00015876BB|nr:putative peptidoglycan glycosyltransferase FtsW [Sulfurovum sp. NBC37-1]BAF71280.1 cell division protein FtsW [Sulfurovum sp. NBC37-1]
MIDKPLLAAVVALLTLSMVMSYSLSTFTVLHFHYDDLHFFLRQSISIFIAFTAMVVLSRLDPDKWFAPVGLTLFFIFFILMIAMQFMPSSLVKAVGGAKRWIHLGPISLAPVEFFKVGFVFFLSWSFARKFSNKNHTGFVDEIRSFMPYIIVFLVAVVIIAVFQKDLGQVVVLGGTLMVMFLFVGSSWKFFLTMLSGIFIAFIGLIFFAPHRMARIKSWWSTVQDSILSVLPFERLETLRVATTAKEPYQISNSLNALHNGGLFGQGLGNGQFKLGYLSEVHTDFILAGITEELGYVGLALVTLTILFIVFRIFKIASKVKNPMYYLFSIGVGLLISFAFILNAYGISGITPIKGIAVPFLSYGGSHIIAACVAIGMVLMVSKKVPRDRNGRML